ncbi:hypothetical protein B484DRAFT_457071, partial [Ochromonadaceae sp. CCMP2298]
ITDPIIETINTRTIAFAPIITPAQVSEFEAYAYDFFESNDYPDLGYTDGIKGVSSVNTSTDNRFHDTEGYQEGGHKVLTPVLQIGNLEVNQPAVMFNLYSQAARVSAIDHMIDCFAAGGTECTSITDIIHLVQDPVFRPAVLILHPVTPYYDKGNLTGLTYIVQNWDTVFETELHQIVKGIAVVLSGGQEEHTFILDNGKASYQGSHTSHGKHSHSANERSFTLKDFGGSVVYSITIYPTKTFTDQFHTNYPYYVMSVSIVVILFTSSIFLLYDHLMARSATARELVTEIETKRLFVRYISHEIRTPLQTMTMGLQLLSTEILSCAEQQQLISLPPDVASTWTEQLRDWRSLISQLEESSGIATMVLNDLINHDKIVMGSLSMELQLVSLWNSISVGVKPFILNARQASVRLVVDSEFEQGGMSRERKCELDSLMVVGDSIKLSQVVRNLVSNALKFSSPGGEVTVTVRWDPEGLEGAPAVPTGSASGTTSIAATPRGTSRNGNPAWTGMPRAGSLVLTVRDGGAGMSIEDQKNLFREGVQFNVNQLQHGGGSGLGLWISKGVVELHNGLLSAYSEGEGLGSEFRCELPLVQMPTSAPQSYESPVYPARSLFQLETINDDESHTSPIPTHTTPKPTPTPTPMDIPTSPTPAPTCTSTSLPLSTIPDISRVLVVDDSGLSRKVLCRLLKKNGFNTAEAGDGVDCVEQMRVQAQQGSGKVLNFEQEQGLPNFHLILMDFEMPRMNGPTATKKLRDMGCNLPIVGVTGNVLADDLDFFMDHGLNYVLTKPLTAEVLMETIGKCNEVRRGAEAGAGAGPRRNSIPATAASRESSLRRIFMGSSKGKSGSGSGTPRSAPLEELPPLQMQVRPVPAGLSPKRPSGGFAVAVGDENV